MDIVVIAHFTGELDGIQNGRFTYICNHIASAGNDKIELITADFSHGRKRKKAADLNAYNYKITLLSESGYPKNVCLKRFISHAIFTKCCVNLGTVRIKVTFSQCIEKIKERCSIRL